MTLPCWRPEREVLLNLCPNIEDNGGTWEKGGGRVRVSKVPSGSENKKHVTPVVQIFFNLIRIMMLSLCNPNHRDECI